MKPYEYLEHTADVKFRAYGFTLEEMLVNAASALFNAMIDTSTVQVQETWRVELKAEDVERLAYEWLSELVYLFEVESAVFSRFQVRLGRDKGWRLEAEVGGERIDLQRHAFDTEVKAVTLHEFEVRKNDIWSIQAVLDV